MEYRKEIDGLRSIAVLPVILFHAGFNVFSGGFVGVDIFFVISGFLITSILVEELRQNDFSIFHFYERRARRIFPALSVVLAFCIVLAFIIFPPYEMQDFASSVRYLCGFVSNIYFYETASYFGDISELKPLLHTWSLSVEEQYYLIFPLLLLFLWKYDRKHLLIYFIGLYLLSLAYAHYQIQYNPSAAFFLLPTRFWELLLGAILAYVVLEEKLKIKGNQTGSFLGILLILLSVFGFNESTPIPSLYTIVPTLGTALIILNATDTTFVGKILGCRLFVGIGLISYSAYLWHQPIFAFSKYLIPGTPSDIVVIFLIITSLILAYFTWSFVEKPFRQKQIVSRKTLLTTVSLAASTFIAFAFISKGTEGMAFRMPDAQKFAQRKINNSGLGSQCSSLNLGSSKCRTSESPYFLLWGDSYAMHLLQALTATKPDLKILQATMAECPPILGLISQHSDHSEKWHKECIEHNDQVIEFLKTERSIKYVVMSSTFSSLSMRNGTYIMRDSTLEKKTNLGMHYFKATLNKLKELGITPIIISPPPEGRMLGACLRQAEFFNRSKEKCNFSESSSRNKQADILQALNELEDGGFRVLFLYEGICDGQICSASKDGVDIYGDNQGHLTPEGSKYIGIKMNLYDRIVNNKNRVSNLELSK